ncbi:MAG: hypothetical protein JNK92_06470 [Dechloromonas sp.]|nr:hypothetical protein [Dechloromonas sp.]
MSELIRFFNVADESGTASHAARAAAIDLGQGSLFGEPLPDCRATHRERRVAYNSAFPSGVPP